MKKAKIPCCSTYEPTEGQSADELVYRDVPHFNKYNLKKSSEWESFNKGVIGDIKRNALLKV